MGEFKFYLICTVILLGALTYFYFFMLFPLALKLEQYLIVAIMFVVYLFAVWLAYESLKNIRKLENSMIKSKEIFDLKKVVK